MTSDKAAAAKLILDALGPAVAAVEATPPSRLKDYKGFARHIKKPGIARVRSHALKFLRPFVERLEKAAGAPDGNLREILSRMEPADGDRDEVRVREPEPGEDLGGEAPRPEGEDRVPPLELLGPS